MAAFFEPVELDRLAQQRVRHLFGITQDPQPGLALGLHGDVPDRQADQPIAGGGFQRRPVDDRRLVTVMGVEQHPAKRGLVRLAARNDRIRAGSLPFTSGTIGRYDRRVVKHRQ